MAIIVNLDVMMARRKIGVTDLAEKVGITMANLSILKNGKAKAVRFSTLERLCDVLNCQPGDILEHVPGTSRDDDDEEDKSSQDDKEDKEDKEDKDDKVSKADQVNERERRGR